MHQGMKLKTFSLILTLFAAVALGLFLLVTTR